MKAVCSDSALLALLLSAFGKWAKWGSKVLDDFVRGHMLVAEEYI